MGENMLALLYSMVGVINLVAYVPTIAKLYRSETACRELPLSSWLTWGTCSLISLVYGIFELGDIPFCAVAAVNLASNIAVLTLASRVRMREFTLSMIPVKTRS